MGMQGKSFYEQDEGRNWAPIILATLASLALHVFLYLRVADMRFDVSAQIPEKFKDAPSRRVVNFERAKDDSEKTFETSETGDPSDRPTVGLTSAELGEIFEAPEIAFSAPPVRQATIEAATFREIAATDLSPDVSVWQPRQEIIQIVDRHVRDEVAFLPRRESFDIERFEAAPDYAPVIELSGTVLVPVKPPDGLLPARAPSIDASLPKPETAVKASVAEPVTDVSATPAVTITKYGEKPEEISEFKHVDNRLSANVTVFAPPNGDGRKYFRLEINPADASVLPIVRKDIVFVQDASRSLARERLYFCKEGLKEAMGSIAVGDRFNIVSFRDDTTFCFGKSWATPNRENFEKAFAFIDSLESQGDTDLFRSLKSLMDLPRDPKRPLIAIVITDGKATIGTTGSSRIIGEFSKLNDNMSLYVLGTHAKANAYLLDMLAFCNRGRQYVVRSDRWSIPAAVRDIVSSCSKPLLGRIKVDAGVASGAEFFPLPSPNLYAGEPLVYYGSCPKETGETVFQVRGEGGDAKIDCLFNIDFSKAPSGGQAIFDEWARRKMHSLIGEYARNPSQALLQSMRQLSAKTGMPIPYFGEF